MSGKCRRDGVHGWGTYAEERRWQVIDALAEVAEETGRSIPQVALRWVMQRPGVTAPVIGARTLEQLEDNLGVLDWSLAPELAARLDAVSSQPWPYPYALHRDSAA